MPFQSISTDQKARTPSGEKRSATQGRKHVQTAPPPGAKPKRLPGNAAQAPRLSGIERIKMAGGHLRGTLRSDLEDTPGHFNEAGKQLLKFHGIYQQRDRENRKAGEKRYSFMVRSRIPGGRLTASQYLAHDALADRFGNGTLRITTRQGLQIHGVIKTELRDTLRSIHDVLLTTLAACGDVVRNTMLSPVPATHPVHDAIETSIQRLAEALLPQTRAYHDVWLDGAKTYDGLAETANARPENAERSNEREEPLYGAAYLPRKFKIGVAYPGDNSVDVYTQDIGLIAIADKETFLGCNILVGGGLGMTHKKPQTYPRLGSLIGFVPAERLIDVVRAIVTIQRDHGDRSNRRHARMKYLIDDWGIDRFVQELEKRLRYALDPPRQAEPLRNNLYLGWRKQLDGRWFYGISVENGRIRDANGLRLKSALRAVIEQLQPGVRLTPNHDVLLADIDEAARPEVEALLDAHGVSRPEALSLARKHAMACPALPTCGLALTEAERVMPTVIDRMEAELASLGLEQEIVSVRMTGCPNGCARPYVADIGLVGRSGDTYAVFLGGDPDGVRLNKLFRDLVPFDDIVPVLRPILRAFREERRDGEGFGSYCARIGNENLNQITEKHRNHA